MASPAINNKNQWDKFLGCRVLGSVSFGTITAASFSIQSDSLISAVLGPGASGDVAVTSSIGTVQSVRSLAFGGIPGAILYPDVRYRWCATTTINRKIISVPTLTDNIVYFGPVRALVTSASPSSLQVTVPAGVVYDLITVTTNSLFHL